MLNMYVFHLTLKTPPALTFLSHVLCRNQQLSFYAVALEAFHEFSFSLSCVWKNLALKISFIMLSLWDFCEWRFFILEFFYVICGCESMCRILLNISRKNLIRKVGLILINASWYEILFRGLKNQFTPLPFPFFRNLILWYLEKCQFSMLTFD
jgi:hypothetical protein